MKKITLITGASSGLGKEYAIQYAKAKQDLYLIARRIDRLSALKSELETQYGITVLIKQVDLSDKAQLESFITTLDPELFINRLINNAGFGYHGAFETTSDKTLSGMIDVNITALTRLCHALIPMMKIHEEGEILNVASMAAYTPGPYMAQYYASKAYVLSFSMALHEELKPYHIKVSALCPGPTQTEFGQAAQYSHEKGIQTVVSMEAAPVVAMSILALEKNRSVAVPGFSNKLAHTLLKFVPRRLSAVIVKTVQKQRL